jgi:hypothetical protein
MYVTPSNPLTSTLEMSYEKNVSNWPNCTNTEQRTWILKYVCSRNWNSKLCSPSLRTLMTVCKLSFDSVTLYTRPKSSGHALRASSARPELYRPKSSLTESEPKASSAADLPRNSHRDVRANPCCGRAEVAWPDLGGGPKTFGSCQ